MNDPDDDKEADRIERKLRKSKYRNNDPRKQAPMNATFPDSDRRKKQGL